MHTQTYPSLFDLNLKQAYLNIYIYIIQHITFKKSEKEIEREKQRKSERGERERERET